jgi:hypothetical protein
MKAVIIGNSPSGIVPDITGVESFGLNRAAITHKTKYAFAGHDDNLMEYERLGMFNVVTIDPTFEGSPRWKFPHCGHIQQAVPGSVFDMQEQRDSTILTMIQHAQRNEDVEYPNYWTILHLCIFYVIKLGFTEIDLVGCQCDYEKYEHNSYDAEKAPYMRLHTEKIIRLAATCGITINWIQ